MVIPLRALTIVALSDGRQRLSPRLAVSPGRHDHSHPVHTLDGTHYVYAAGNGPPTIARRLHEYAALQPFTGAKRRRIAAETAAIEFETKQLQPVAQAQQTDE